MTDEPRQPGALDIAAWLAMWLRPRATVRRVLDQNPKRDVLVLAALAGVTSAFDAAGALTLGDRYANSDIVIVAIVAGALGGLVGLYVWGWLVALTGRWLGGKAGPREARTAVAWGNAPAVWALPVYALGLWLFGKELFETSQPRIEALPGLGVAYLAVAPTLTVMGVWGFVVLVRAVAEAHRFGAWKGLASVLLAAVPVLVAAAALTFAVASLSSDFGLTFRIL
jgi:hypothetical protein